MLPLRMLCIGLLMFSLCDADTACPEELNPLSLDPPEIMGEYGTEVLVNCTSTVVRDGMYWRVRNESFGIEAVENFVGQSVLLSDWNVAAECKIKLNKSHECSKALEITVYKNPEVISSMKLVNATPKETQYELKCDTINVAPVQNLTVKWYKNKELIETKFFNDTTKHNTKTPVNESSDLSVTVRRGEEVQMRCEAQLNFVTHGLQLPVIISQTLNVSAQYPPELSPKKDTEYIVAPQDEDITLECTAEGNPPPVFSWTYDGMNMSESSNTLKVTGVNASATYTCTASNYLGNTTKQFHVRVIPRVAAPAALPTAETTTSEDADTACPEELNPLSLDPPEIMGEYGTEVLVNCTSTVVRDGMYWRVRNESFGIEAVENFVGQSVLLSDWNVAAECKIKLNKSHECSKALEITVYKNPEVISSMKLVNATPKETQYELKCDTINVAPVQNLTVKWYKNKELIETKFFNDTTKHNTKTPVNESSDLSVTVRRGEEVQMRCEAQLNFVTHGLQLPVIISQTLNVSAQYPPELSPKKDTEYIVAPQDEDITLECTAEGNPPPVFSWTYDGMNMSESSNTLKVTGVNASATYTCTASNYLGNTTKQFHVRVIPRVAAPAALPTAETTTSEDADTACPEELNPLSLDPPEIMGEYGTEVLVNCTSTVVRDGMYWRVRNESFGIEAVENFVGQSVLLSDWNVAAECKIKLNKSHECSKALEITVYKNPEVISSMKLVNATPKETQYELKCDTINVAPVQNLTVKWYKNKELIETKFFNDTTKHNTKTPVNESSDLSVTVRRGEEVQMRCEAQLNFVTHGLQLPVIISQTLNVSAQYPPELSPEKDTEYIVAPQDEDITLKCTAEGNPPPVFSWTYDGMNMSETSTTLKVTGVNASATYTCTASNYLGNTTKQFHVRVIPRVAAPAALPTAETTTSEEDCLLTVTPSEVVVRFGDPASVNCSTSATNAVGMGWESSVGGTGFQPPPVATWMVEKLEDWTAVPSCFVTLDTIDVKQCFQSPTIILYKTPDTVSVSAVHPGPMVEGTNFYLKCDISNVAPVQNLKVKWYHGNEIVRTQLFLHTNTTPQNVFSTLTITPKRDYNGSLFRCEAELHLGPNGPEPIPTEKSEPYTAIVHYAPQFREGNSSKEISLGENVTLECSAEGNPDPVLRWNFSSAANLKETTVGRQKTITITRATSTNAGVYICVATNKLGNVTRSVTLVMKGSSAAPMAVIWGVLIVLAIFIILIVMVILHNRQKRHGQYSFVPVHTKDGVPMTTMS